MMPTVRMVEPSMREVRQKRMLLPKLASRISSSSLRKAHGWASGNS
jgi:hypothetical protein